MSINLGPGNGCALAVEIHGRHRSVTSAMSSGDQYSLGPRSVWMNDSRAATASRLHQVTGPVEVDHAFR
jgi:hypothetical protein